MVSIAPGSTTSGLTTQDRGLVHDHEVSFPGDQRVLLGRSYIAWSAVAAGALTSLAILILLGSLGSAFGIAAYRGGAFGVVAAFWAIASSVVAFFCGGCLVSYLAPHSEQRSGAVHGMMAWVLAVMLMSTAAAWAIGSTRLGMAFNPLGSSITPGVEFTHGQIAGAAWTAFICLSFGLIAAIIGGMAGYSGKLANMEENMEKNLRR